MLACWRAAVDAYVLLDDLPLDWALWWLGGARGDAFHAPPYPMAQPACVGGWRRVVRGGDVTLTDAHSVAEAT